MGQLKNYLPILKDVSDPTTSTVGMVGQKYINSTSGDIFLCVIASTTYTWKKIKFV